LPVYLFFLFLTSINKIVCSIPIVGYVNTWDDFFQAISNKDLDYTKKNHALKCAFANLMRMATSLEFSGLPTVVKMHAAKRESNVIGGANLGGAKTETGKRLNTAGT